MDLSFLSIFVNEMNDRSACDKDLTTCHVVTRRHNRRKRDNALSIRVKEKVEEDLDATSTIDANTHGENVSYKAILCTRLYCASIGRRDHEKESTASCQEMQVI